MEALDEDQRKLLSPRSASNTNIHTAEFHYMPWSEPNNIPNESTSSRNASEPTRCQILQHESDQGFLTLNRGSTLFAKNSISPTYRRHLLSS